MAATEDFEPNGPRYVDPSATLMGDATLRRNPYVGDLLNHGHEFLIVSGAAPRAPRLCRVCSYPIVQPAPRWICEFSDGQYVTQRPGAKGHRCRCNWCLTNMDVRDVGRPVEVHAWCAREDARRSRAAERARADERARFRAVEVIRAEPFLTDKDIAAMLDIRRVRVKEARKMLSG